MVGPGREPSEVDPGVLDAVRAMQRRAFEIAVSWRAGASQKPDPPALDRLAEIAARTLVSSTGPHPTADGSPRSAILNFSVQ
ncbi:hypothetical protein GCM10009819_32220 [Agromyces tropicus]|uniref:Uncharacterized protein n=1 Tax=Agromyces tropicus TaxID=555371 RepID=A0ABN2UUA2_9MICO